MRGDSRRRRERWRDDLDREVPEMGAKTILWHVELSTTIPAVARGKHCEFPAFCGENTAYARGPDRRAGYFPRGSFAIFKRPLKVHPRRR
jgi:hypothetical protein